MKGSMRERLPGVWEVRVYVGVDPVTGTKRVASRQVKGGKREAQVELARFVAELSDPDAAGRRSSTAVTLTRLINEHLAAWDGSATTLASYRSILSNHVEPTIGRLPLAEVDARILDRFYRWLRDEKGLAPSTIKSVHALIRGSFRHAVVWGWVASNPAADARPPTVHRTGIVLPSAVDLAGALAALEARDLEFATFVRVVASTGARRGEVCGLTWGAVDLGDAMMRIDTAVIATTETGVLVQDTKNHVRRSVGLDAVTVEVLGAHQAVMAERAAAVGAVLSGGSFVFSHSPTCDRPWRPDNVSTRWDRIRDGLGLAGVRLHDLRHFQATMLLKAGVPVKNVSKRLGHRDSSTTINVYAQFLEETDRESADLIGKLLARPD